MKRKRGKKGKSKKLPVAVSVTSAEETVENVGSASMEDDSGPEDIEKEDVETKLDAETPSSTGTDQQPEKLASVSSGGQVDKPVGKLVYNRVKVKIKSSKALESQLTSSDAHTHSDTDKSSPHVAVDKQVVVADKVEDSANSLPEVTKGVSVYQSKKAGGIKIKSKGFSSSSLSPCNNAGLVQVEKTHQKEPELPRQDSKQKEPELPPQDSKQKEPELPRQESHQKEPELPRRDSKQKEPELPRQESHQKEPELPRRDSHQIEPELPRRESHQKEPELPRRESHQKEPPLPRRESHQKEPELPRRESLQKEPELPHRGSHQKEPDLSRRDSHQKKPELPRRESHYSKQELDAALEVIKKIMKMDAAEPFNAPVNPIALGIPDYFDVIDMPMDFGTICHNLENGVNYKNSEDVFKDVQYIWENCYKYNNKGDYILELMKRVKKNFSKYWSAAGLYSEHPQSTSGGESIQAKDVTPTNSGKLPVKGSNLKQKMRKRHGVKRHKDDCLCAICVMMRRRQEREESSTVDDMETSDGHLARETKAEGTSNVGSPEGTSSSMDNSQDQDADTEMEDKVEEVKSEGNKQSYLSSQDKQMEQKGNEMPFNTKEEGEISEHSPLGGRSGEEHSKDSDAQMAESGDDIQKNANKEISMRHGDETTAAEHHKPKEGLSKSEKAKIYEDLHRRFGNPKLLELCGTVFTENHKSIWSGRHSLNQHEASSRSSSIHSAISTFMK